MLPHRARRAALAEATVAALTNKLAGTFAYMAPEPACHHHSATTSDLYGYAVTLLASLQAQQHPRTLCEVRSVLLRGHGECPG